MKKLLIISPHFPPLNAPDMQRVRLSLPHYRKHGWDPVVLTLEDRHQEGVREPELLATLPPGLRIIRIPAIPLRFARWLGSGTTGLRVLPHLLWHGTRLLRRERFDLVFFSNTQFITFPLGRLWRALFRVPYVIDIQDPWRTDYYERPGSQRPPGGWKYQFARFQAWLLEGWTYRSIGGAMSVSPEYLAELVRRYPAFGGVPREVIRFGTSHGDLDQAREGAPATPAFVRRPDEIHFVYTGASGPAMPHALTALFDGLRHFGERQPDAAARLRFHFVGTSYVAPGTGVETVMPLARMYAVDGQVDEVSHRIGHFEALRWQLQADVLLLPGSSDLAYSPSKLYPYILTGRPILGLVFRGSVLERQLEELNCAYLVRFTAKEPNDGIRAGLATFFGLALDGFPAGTLPQCRADHFNRTCLAEELTRRQCELFDQVIALRR